ncbi:MAG: cytochrome c oxidase assembly protein [Rhodospirillales bacterium]|nr:cytochrome c oxidase assembly protein [Rhodospirillales bacterium]
MSDDGTQGLRRRNRGVATMLGGLVVGMVGLAFASVPLYRLFCDVTGFGGTPRVGLAGSSSGISDREIEVRFDSNVAAGLPWVFEAELRSVRVRLGEEVEAHYRVRNLSKTKTIGTSTFNVSPNSAGPHFVKVQCFCFTEQTLQPGEEAILPVRFYVEPEIGSDRDARDITAVTLSYTFFPAKTGAAAPAASAVAALGAK